MSWNNLLTITPLIFLLQITFRHTSATDYTLYLHRTTIRAQIGEEIHITCEASTCEKPAFIWSSLVDNTLSGTVSTVGQKSTLTMKISSGSSGYYRCTVSCNKAPPEKHFKIIVYSFPSDPILHISSSVVGEQSRITCTLPNVYPSVRMSAKIMLGTEEVVEYNGAELAEYDQEINSISFFHDLVLEESYEAKKIECVAEMALQDDEDDDDVDIDPIRRHTTMDLKLMYPPVKPQIRLHPSTTVRAGEEISLACSSESGSQAYIQWLRLVDGKKREMPTDEQGILTLSSVEPEDSGVYICCAKNNVGETSSQVEITVQGVPEIPKITIHPGATVTAGQAVTITCFANGDTNTNVTLWKVSEDREILLLDKEGKFSIKAADPADTAEYRCIVENQYGLAETSESLTVTYPPRETVLSSSAMDVNEGDTVTLTCVSKGDPKPNISLYTLSLSGESVLLSNGPVVTLTNVTSGIYQCQASNLLGRQEDTLELRVQVPPKNTYITITPSPVVREGDSVHITCTSEAFPAPILVLKIRTENGLIELESESGQYNISHTGTGDIGTYICESKNEVGQQIAETFLTVQVPPKNTYITITPSPVVREGDSVHITCTSEASPAPILLLKIRTENGLIELESESGQYNISHTGAGDIGTYICESKNVVGQQRAETSLTVQVPPKNTYITITPSPVVRKGDSVHITCTSEASPAPILVLKIRTENGLIALESEGGQYSISHAEVGHIGTYICESKNVAGQQIVETPLTVQVPPKNTYINITPSPVVREGDSVHITCTSEASPAPMLVLKIRTENGLIELESESGQYSISHAEVGHIGTYICESKNVAGHQIAETPLTVQVPPKNTYINITPSPVVREGDSVHITCTSEASPAPMLVLKIRTENGLIELESESGQYSISHAEVGHIGTYICESKNVAGHQIAETPLTVQVPPKNTYINITPSPVVREGDSVHITCTSEASPAPMLVLKIRTENGLIDLESESGQYNISHTGVGDKGTYICESKNVAGQQTAETPLTVQEQQQRPKFNPISVIIGSVAFVSAGIIGAVIYLLKQAKVQGSYSLVKALRSKV